MFAIATLPVILGVVIRRLRPSVRGGFERGCSRLANILFAVILLATLISQWGVFTANLTVLGPVLLSLNLLMLLLGSGLGPLLGLPSDQVTTLAIESGFQNGTVGIVVGAMLSQPGSNAVLTEMSLPSAVYGVLMLVTVAPFVMWRRSLGTRG